MGFRLGLGFGLKKHNNVGRVIPTKSDAIVWLDGTISGNNFVDKISGRLFPIANKDFPAGWVKGFPYKSAATFSAPAGDAELIAKDVNGFFYTAGVPNQIPVISLYQDVDYAHRLFARSIAQTVDVNGVELTESYVTDITLYLTAKSGNDLILCQSYFSVTAEDAMYWWVDWINGSDAAGVGLGTKIAPYKTINRLSNLKSTGNSYIKSSSDPGGTGGNLFIYFDDSLSYKAIGLVKKTITGTTYAVRFQVTDAVVLENFILLPVSSLSTGVIWGANGINATIKNIWTTATGTNFLQASIRNVLSCIIQGNYTTAVFLLTGVDTGIIAIKNNYINVNSAYGLLENASTAHGKREIFNNKIRGTYTNTLFNIDVNLDYCKLYGNDVDLTSGTYIVNSDSNIGYNEILNNRFTLRSTYTQNCVQITNGISFLHKINNNIFNAVSVFANHYIFTNNTYSEVKNNLFNCFSGDASLTNSGCVVLQRSALVTTTFNLIEISGNKILSNRTRGYNLAIGNEGTTASDNKNTESIIKNNYIKGANAWEYVIGVITHTTYIGFQSNAKILFNYVFGGGYGAIIKGSRTTVGGNIRGNVIIDSDKGIYSKGAQNIVMNNNTIVMTSRITQPEWGVFIGPNIDEANGCVVRNNIIISLSSGVFNAVNIRTSGTNQSDYNIFYCPSGTLQFILGESAYTFAQWKALGFDTHSIVLTDVQYAELFTDATNGDYSLREGSIAIGFGTNLGEPYNIGLDASTNWGSDTQLPSVVTKLQPTVGGWDCGAYIH